MIDFRQGFLVSALESLGGIAVTQQEFFQVGTPVGRLSVQFLFEISHFEVDRLDGEDERFAIEGSHSNLLRPLSKYLRISELSDGRLNGFRQILRRQID